MSRTNDITTLVTLVAGELQMYLAMAKQGNVCVITSHDVEKTKFVALRQKNVMYLIGNFCCVKKFNVKKLNEIVREYGEDFVQDVVLSDNPDTVSLDEAFLNLRIQDVDESIIEAKEEEGNEEEETGSFKNEDVSFQSEKRKSLGKLSSQHVYFRDETISGKNEKKIIADIKAVKKHEGFRILRELLQESRLPIEFIVRKVRHLCCSDIRLVILEKPQVVKVAIHETVRLQRLNYLSSGDLSDFEDFEA